MSDTVELFGMKDSNPESKLISKEENNPCIGCRWEFSLAPEVLDFCHGGIDGKMFCDK
jgi:hypothetical protein